MLGLLCWFHLFSGYSVLNIELKDIKLLNNIGIKIIKLKYSLGLNNIEGPGWKIITCIHFYIQWE